MVQPVMVAPFALNNEGATFRELPKLIVVPVEVA